MNAHDEQSLVREACSFVSALVPSEHAVVVTLSGDLGTGKTTFVRAMLQELGVLGAVISPTFVLERIYYPTRGLFKKVVHIDAYRLTSAHELEALGWRDILAERDTLILLEWPEMVADLIPKEAKRVTLAFVEDTKRTLIYG